MFSTAAAADHRRRALLRARAEIRSPKPSEIAWIAALPLALVVIGAILLLGPALGRALLTPNPARETFWPFVGAVPQTTQHGRFLVGLVGPPLLVAVVLASAHPRVRSRLRMRGQTIGAFALAGQMTLLSFVVVCFAVQNNIVISGDFVNAPHRAYFTWQTLGVAAVLPVLALAVLRSERGAHLAAVLLRETPGRRTVGLLVAITYIAPWMLTAINLDSSIGNTIEGVSGHLLWTMGETFAVLNGRTPLVDYHAQYGQVWAYLAAVPMALFGATIGTYSITMAAGSMLALVAVYATFRRLVGSSLLALGLFLPFLATAAFMVIGPPSDRFGSQNLYILWPIRYAGPFLLAWLTARHVDHAAPRHASLVFAVVGFVTVNSMDFGLASGMATLVALAFAAPTRSWRAMARLIGAAVGGILASIALFSLYTLLRAGSLPHFGLLFEFGRLYGIGGWAQLPMPVLGFHLALFLTFVIALVVAATRVANRDEDRLMTAMLAWIGMFGLATSVYYVGRAHPLTLFHFFGPWAFALALLLVVVSRDLAARGWRRPTLPEFAVLFGFGLLLCSLPQTPAPGPQLARIRDRTPTPLFKQAEAVRLLRQSTRPGERVLVLTTLGHRVAYDAGVVNVSPYTSIESMPTQQQLQRALDALYAAGGHKLYLFTVPAFTRPEVVEALQAMGFRVERFSPSRAFVEMTALPARPE